MYKVYQLIKIIFNYQLHNVFITERGIIKLFKVKQLIQDQNR